MKKVILAIQIVLFALVACRAQNQTKMTEKNNPLLCNPVQGICGTADSTAEKNIANQHSEKSVKVIYFTDPICSACWGIEPQLRKLKLEYGNQVEIEYRMGGLLPDWNYNVGGISKPSDVAHHWDEVSAYYDMPIDGDIWLEDPLSSSYPPSIAFKAAQLQDQEKALLFLREVREMVFLYKKNIAKWDNIATAATKVGIDTVQLKKDFEGRGKLLFEEDLKAAKTYGVRGFPTLFFINQSGNKEIIYGTKPYPFFETAILKLNPKAEKQIYSKNWEHLFANYYSLTAKEFAELSGIDRSNSETQLNELVSKGKLEKFTTKHGAIWMMKK